MEPASVGAAPAHWSAAALSVQPREHMPTDETDAPPAREREGAPDDAPEELERAAAQRRGEARERERAAGTEPPRDVHTGHAPAGVAARAFAALAENVRDYAIFLMDPAGVITFWGQGAHLLKWWTKDQAEGAHLRLLYPAGGSEDGTAEGHLRDAVEQGEYVGEGQRVRSDGSTFWGGITLTALWDEDDTLLGFSKVTRDLTARRAADVLLQAAVAEAEAARAAAISASAAKSGFLASMSHEIRTPINAILGYHEVLALEIDGPLTPGQRRHLARASESSGHLLGLIAEVLDFSRIEAEHVTVERATVRVGDAVAGALGLVMPQARARGLEVTDAVGGYAAGLAAWGDEVRVRQILVNLLGNAVKFTEPRPGASGAGEAGRIEPGRIEAGRITVSAGAATQPSPEARLAGEGPWVYIRVEDTGAGIPADRLEPIFEAFVQADMTLTRRYGGTGLGLAISRRLARLMGGDVTARSEVGVGSTFFLWLPAAPVESLSTGGLPGHGPGGEAPAADGPGGRTSSAEEATDAEAPSGAPSSGDRAPGDPSSGGGPLRAVADALLAELERVLHAYVARLRSDPATPSAHGVAEAQIENHLASFLADLAGTLARLDRSAGGPEGEPAAALRDPTAIQRVVAERHGRQRVRLGWHEREIRREFTILREELTSAVQRQAPRHLRGRTPEAGNEQTERALELLAQFLARAEQVSVASYRQARDEPTETGEGAPA